MTTTRAPEAPRKIPDIEWTRVRLRRFSTGGSDLGDPAIDAYRRFYGLDFEHYRPGLRVRMGIEPINGYDIVIHHYRQTSAASAVGPVGKTHPDEAIQSSADNRSTTGTNGTNGTNVAGQEEPGPILCKDWQSPSPATSPGTVFLVHGYYDHVGLYTQVIGALLDAGFSVVAYDLPGHGLSSGEQAAIPDFHRYRILFQRILTLFQDDAAQPWHAVGQSTGGAIIIDYLLDHARRRRDIPFSRAVLLAPLVRPKGYGLGKYIHTVVSPFTAYIKRNFSVNSGNPSFLQFLHNVDPLQSKRLSTRWVGALKRWVPIIEASEPSDFPLLIIQGQQDGTVDFEHNLMILAEKFPHSRTLLLPDARHQLVNESADLRARIFGKMLEYLSQQQP